MARQKIHNEEQVKEAWSRVPDALAKLGYSELRQAQKDCLESIFAGEDTFCILPTGGGKTLIAALPAVVFKWRAVIFSPLVALMRDQVQSFLRRGIRAGSINSANAEVENTTALQAWIQGDQQILLVAPEQIKEGPFMNAMRMIKPDLVVLDEAHTMSEWASGFRPAYNRCGEFVAEMNPKLVVAMTATATKEIIEDVTNILGIPEATIQRHYYPRTNLKLSSKIMNDVDNAHADIVRILRTTKGSAIVYCSSVKHVTELVEYLTNNGIDCTFYHGQMTNITQKQINQDNFMNGTTRVIVATNAFGMGIDKPDIELIIHADIPGSIEAIAQETGRAARDGREAQCIMYMTEYGMKVQEFLWNMGSPSRETVQFVYNYIKSTADSSGVSYATLEEMKLASGDDSAPNAIGSLVSFGVIGRADAPQIAHVKFARWVTHTEPVIPKTTPQRTKILNAVVAGGIVKDDNWISCDLSYIVKTAGVAKNSVTAVLRQLAKDGLIDYEGPKRSKASILLKDLTEDHLKMVEYRREQEANKMQGVRMYVSTPDEQKQQFLLDYFSRQ